MANRLTRIYTRTGDDGTTGLATGERVDKCDARVEAGGTVDETNCALGVVLAHPDLPEDLRATLAKIQHELFDVGGELSLPGHAPRIEAAHVAWLERELERLNAGLPALKEFILPGGTPAAAACHMARAVCRRAERCVWALAKHSPVDRELARYLNRLSDLLFVIARRLARAHGGAEVLWQRVESSHGPTR